MRDGSRDVLEKLIASRAARLGVTLDEARFSGRSKPLFLEAAEKCATKLGISVDEVLRADLESIADSDYPGPNCLTPDEVYDYAEGHQLPDDRIAHLEGCLSCGAILNAIHPPEELVRKYMEEVRQLWLAVEEHKKRTSYPTPAK